MLIFPKQQANIISAVFKVIAIIHAITECFSFEKL